MRKWLHRLLKGASLTGALFVFQACYGTPPGPLDYEELPSSDEMEMLQVLSDGPTEAPAVDPETGEEIVPESESLDPVE